MRVASVEIRRDPVTRVFKMPEYTTPSEDIYKKGRLRPSLGCLRYDWVKSGPTQATVQLITAMRRDLALELQNIQDDLSRLNTILETFQDSESYQAIKTYYEHTES